VASVIVGHALDVAKNPSATSAACVPAPESGSFHPRTKPPHFLGDSSQPLQYPVTFSTKNGSVESLKCSVGVALARKPARCGAPVDFDKRVSSAICRILQCVPSFGFVSSVLRTNRATPLITDRAGGGLGAIRHATRTHPAPGIAVATCPPSRWSSHLNVQFACSSCGGTQQNNPGSAHQSAGRDRELAMPSSCSAVRPQN